MRGNWWVSYSLDLKADEELPSEPLLFKPWLFPRVTPLSVFSVIVGVGVSGFLDCRPALGGAGLSFVLIFPRAPGGDFGQLLRDSLPPPVL